MRWAFNPIALAQVAVSGSEKGRPWPDSWAAVEELFRKAYKSDAHAVFYGSGGAPALIDLLDRVADLAPKAATLDALRKIPAVRELEDRLANPDWLARLLAFVVPVSDLGFTPPGAEPAVTEHPSIGSYEQIGALEVGDVSWRDPEQGSTADCYLIATMISLAWARPRTWRQHLAKAAELGKDKLHVAFNGDDIGEADPPAFDVPARVPLDADHNWIYAHSADHDETWPAMIERAFVMLRRNLPAGEPTVDDYRKIGETPGSVFPHQAARILLGGTPFAHRAGPAVMPFPFVVERCEDSLTTSPTMAWTWEKGDEHAAGIDWASTTLTPAHAYAVLGLMTDSGSNFVVLRNPYGHNPPVPPGGNWTEGSARNGGTPVQLNDRGVIAISEQTFNACFKGVDGVVLAAD